MPTLLSPKSNNWVDRGAAPDATLSRILAHTFDRHAVSDHDWLAEHARAILGLVAAHGTETHITGYLRSIARSAGLPAGAPEGARMVAVALWHAAKVAVVRDFAERVLQGHVPVDAPTEAPLSRWLAQRLLTTEEVREFESERQERDSAK